MSQTRDAMAAQLLEQVAQKSYRRGDFTLSSGKKSQHYINGKMVLLDPKGAELFAKWVVEDVKALDSAPVAVGGLELGAVPVACCVMSHSSGQLRTFIVRKQKKGHGAEQKIEGVVEAGDKVVVVDDVITTGAATQKAIDAVEAAGAEVVAVYCLVDRQENTLPALAARGIRSAMTLADLIAATGG